MEGPENYLSPKQVADIWGVNAATFKTRMHEFLSDGSLKAYETTESGWRELHYPKDWQRTRRFPKYLSRQLADMADDNYWQDLPVRPHPYFKESDIEKLGKEKSIERNDKPKDQQLSSEKPLNGKKAIATFLCLADKNTNFIKTVDTYIRKGMPVHQPSGLRGPIFAFPSEINEWIRSGKKD